MVSLSPTSASRPRDQLDCTSNAAPIRWRPLSAGRLSFFEVLVRGFWSGMPPVCLQAGARHSLATFAQRLTGSLPARTGVRTMKPARLPAVALFRRSPRVCLEEVRDRRRASQPPGSMAWRQRRWLGAWAAHSAWRDPVHRLQRAGGLQGTGAGALQHGTQRGGAAGSLRRAICVEAGWTAAAPRGGAHGGV